MIEVISKEEAEWRKNNKMHWIAMDNDGFLIDSDEDLTILDIRIQNRYKTKDFRKKVIYSKVWHVPEIGEKCYHTNNK